MKNRSRNPHILPTQIFSKASRSRVTGGFSRQMLRLREEGHAGSYCGRQSQGLPASGCRAHRGQPAPLEQLGSSGLGCCLTWECGPCARNAIPNFTDL